MKSCILFRTLSLAVVCSLSLLAQTNAETMIGLRDLSPGSYTGDAETTSPRTFNTTTDAGSLSNVSWSDGGYSGVVDISFVATTSGGDNIKRGGAGAFGIVGGTDTLIEPAEGTITLSDIVFTYVSGDTLDKIASIKFAAVYIGNWSSGETGTLNGTAITTGDPGGNTTATGRNELGSYASSVVVTSTNGAFSINGVDIAVTAAGPGTISWGAATDVSAATDVITTGTLVEAFNAGQNGVANRTVNGVTFIGTGTLLDQNSSINAFSGSTGDPSYDALLNDIDYGGGTNTVSLQIGGGNLVAGADYLVQVWYADNRYTTRETPVGDGATTPNKVTLGCNPGQYATGTFTAAGTTQTITLESPSFGNAHINAYQIRTLSSAPVPSLTTAASPVSAPFTVNCNFTETITGLEESDFSVSNGTVTASSLAGSGTSYTVEITPSSNGDVTVSLPENSVTDTDGDNHQNPASNLLTVLYIAPGSDQPTVTLSTPSATVGTPYVVTVNFSEAVTGLDASDFQVDNGSATNLLGSGSAYTVDITPTAEGDVTVTLPANSVTDNDGDGLMNPASSQLVTLYQPPSVPTVTLNGSLSTDSSTYKLFITFSEGVTGLDVGDFSVVNGTVSDVAAIGRDRSTTANEYITSQRYYKAVITAAMPGTVEVTLPAGVVTDVDGDNATNTASNLLSFQCTTDFGETWVIDEQADWTAATGSTSNTTIANGTVEPTADNSEFSSTIKTFSVRKKAKSVTFQQSPTWDNWTEIAGGFVVSGAGDATILLPVANDDYYFLGKYSGDGYHAWHSTDMVNWTRYGQVTTSEHRWVTSAEYKDGQFYIFLDYPNDHTPHLYIDDDLKDGQLGTFMGMVYNDPSHGSDSSIIRDNADGLFHIISEDWSPINAKDNAWDSPIATHATSLDAISGFTAGEHAPPIDLRTTPTGTFGTYNHPHVAGTHISNPLSYEIHSPAQDAFGDWTSIKVGSQYYMFADFDHADHSTMSCALFTSDSIYDQYELVGDIKTNGHPDPTIGFAEGQFYLITQQKDFTSPGPWVNGVEARAGVDTDGNGTIDQWTAWQTVSEGYDHTPGFARVVTTTPAQVDMSALPAGFGFQFEFKVDDTVVSGFSPIMDAVKMEFEPSHFQQWANTASTQALIDGDHNGNGIANVFEFALGLTSMQSLYPNSSGLLSLTLSKDALDDGYSLLLEYSDDLDDWDPATSVSTPVKLLSSTPQANGDLVLQFEFDQNANNKTFWRLKME